MDGTVHPLTTSTNDKTERTRSWKDPLGSWQVPNPGEWIWGSASKVPAFLGNRVTDGQMGWIGRGRGRLGRLFGRQKHAG